jgi:hypothetical protein
LPDDAREDDEFKQELHERVHELRETLHNIANDRKDKAEKERADTMDDGWVLDHLGLLTNHYITLMQVDLAIAHNNGTRRTICSSERNRPVSRCIENASRLLQGNATADTRRNQTGICSTAIV